jgi:molybdopterin-guanine dinucleotide biosynthesis adapter protein
MPIPVVTIIGKSGSGKTTLMEGLIPELCRRGYQLATVKHHSHSGFEIDHPGKDSWRHARAGSRHVIIAAPDKIASYRLLDRELSLDEVVHEVRDVDIILAEGYKYAKKPTIEIIRADVGLELVSRPEQLLALVTDTPMEIDVPQFGLDEFASVADLIESRLLAGKT